MTDEDLGSVLRSERAAAEFARDLRFKAAIVPGQAVDLTSGADEDLAVAARRFVYWLRDLAIRALAEANPPHPANRVALAGHAVEAELELRRQTLARIDALLTDTTRLPTDEQVEAGQAPAPMRVCDYAYLFMRRMVNVDDPVEDEAAFAATFCKMSLVERTARIRRARDSVRWKRAARGEGV